mmetsp:Transcript_115369/g.337322  ORF Transcript_115369/g.337322 Transcript_115369/m.337322 type:complete len:521 (-) Transcript_115369:1116-2678(-)
MRLGRGPVHLLVGDLTRVLPLLLVCEACPMHTAWLTSVVRSKFHLVQRAWLASVLGMPAHSPVLAVALVVGAPQPVPDPRAAIVDLRVERRLPAAVAEDLEALPPLLRHGDPVDEAAAVKVHVSALEVVPRAGNLVSAAPEVAGHLLRADVREPAPDDLPVSELLLVLAVRSLHPLAGRPGVADPGHKDAAAFVTLVRLGGKWIPVLELDVGRDAPSGDKAHGPALVAAGLRVPHAEHEADKAHWNLLRHLHAEGLGQLVVLRAQDHEVERGGLPILWRRGVVQVCQGAEDRVVADSLVCGAEAARGALEVLLHLEGSLHAKHVTKALQDGLLHLHVEGVDALRLANLVLLHRGRSSHGQLLALPRPLPELLEELFARERADERALELDELLQLRVAVRLGRLDVQKLGLPVALIVLVKVRVTIAHEDLLALVHVRGGVELQDPAPHVQRALGGRLLRVVVEGPQPERQEVVALQVVLEAPPVAEHRLLTSLVQDERGAALDQLPDGGVLGDEDASAVDA